MAFTERHPSIFVSRARCHLSFRLDMSASVRGACSALAVVPRHRLPCAAATHWTIDFKGVGVRIRSSRFDPSANIWNGVFLSFERERRFASLLCICVTRSVSSPYRVLPRLLIGHVFEGWCIERSPWIVSPRSHRCWGARGIVAVNKYAC